jgi:hypothetical protein
MKRGIIVAMVALALCAAGFLVSYRSGTTELRTMETQADAELQWLRREFHLTAEQAGAVSRLHAAYQPRCAAMCEQIAANRARLDRLIATNRKPTEEMNRLLRESAEIQAECRREMLAHIYAVAECMPAGESERYLTLMKPQVLQPGTPHDDQGLRPK